VKTAAIGAISAGVAVVAFILVFVGIGSNQAEKPIDYQKTLEETISTKSNSSQPSAPEEQTDYQRELEESVSSESDSPPQLQSNDCSGSAGCYTDYVNRIVDGDTIHTATLKIRLSLTNAPETYQDGFREATEFTEKLCPVGSKILVDQDDLQRVDQYGRVLAKVFCGDKVLNSELLYNGHANILTQYCSTSEFSGEAWAKRYGCDSNEIQLTTIPSPPTPVQPKTQEISCDPSYPDFCIPPPPPDLDCKDIPQKNFRVLQPDPHRFDGDKDGIGCESS
jgi:micrococcal nuclease